MLEGEARPQSSTTAGTFRSSPRPAPARPRSSRSGSPTCCGDGEPAESIVAFTFTEKAAEELKERIRQRVTHVVGDDAADQLGQLFVGTIHGYCFRLLQTYVPKYETYTPLDANQLVNLLYREGSRLKLKQFGGGKLFKASTTSFGASTSSRTSCSTPTSCRSTTSATHSWRTTRCSTATGSCPSGPRSSGPSRRSRIPKCTPRSRPTCAT